MSDDHGSDQRRGKKGGCLQWVGRAALAVLVVLVVSMTIGAIYQTIASAQDAKKYKPIHQLVAVDSIQMNLNCRGSGSPTVVLEAGASSSSLSWIRIQDEVAGFTRVCSYDRAGMGWSDAIPGEVSPQKVAEMLHSLLEKGGQAPPYLLVGHSLGGVYVRAFASQYPDDVAGMVLVDSSHENQNQRFPPEYTQINETQAYAFQFCRLSAPFGLIRAAGIMDSVSASFSLSDAEKDALLAEMNRTGYCSAAMREMNMFNAYAGQPKTVNSLGDIPLIVLSAGRDAQEMYNTLPAAFQQQVTLEVIQQVVSAWDTMQDELAALSTRGKRILVENSGHNIQLDAPEVVIGAIREVFDQASP